MRHVMVGWCCCEAQGQEQDSDASKDRARCMRRVCGQTKGVGVVNGNGRVAQINGC